MLLRTSVARLNYLTDVVLISNLITADIREIATLSVRPIGSMKRHDR